MSGSGRLSLRSVANLVLQKLDTTGEKQCWKHVSPNCFQAQRMAFKVMLLNLPASDAPVMSTSANEMSSNAERVVRKFWQMAWKAIRLLRYLKTVLGENPSKIRII